MTCQRKRCPDVVALESGNGNSPCFQFGDYRDSQGVHLKVFTSQRLGAGIIVPSTGSSARKNVEDNLPQHLTMTVG